MAKDDIRGIFFDIDKFERTKLSKMSEQELYDTAIKNDCIIMTLDGISEAVNDDALPDFDNWLFFVDLNNVK